MKTQEKMERCCAYIDTHWGDEIREEELAAMNGCSVSRLRHVFSEAIGVSLGEYLRNRRLSQAAMYIRSGRPIGKSGLECGFQTSSSLTRAFSKRYGITPAEYREGLKREAAPPVFYHLPQLLAAGTLIPVYEAVDMQENGAYWLGRVKRDEAPGHGLTEQREWGEIGVWVPEWTDGKPYYFLGTVLEEGEAIPKNVPVLALPEADYMAFAVEPAATQPLLRENVLDTLNRALHRWNSHQYMVDPVGIWFEHYLGDKATVFVGVAPRRSVIPLKTGHLDE